MKSVNFMSVAVLFLLSAAVMFSGCLGVGQDENISVAIGYQPSTHQAAYTVADAKGWWADNLSALGVTSVTDNVFPSGPSEMTALSADAIQVAYVGSAPVITSIAAGNNIKIVAAVQTNGSSILVGNNVTYNGPQDLKGLTIATFTPGSIQDTLLRDWLKENGLTPDVDVTIKGMSSGDAITALRAGAVSAVFLPHPAPTTIESEGIGRVVVRSGEILDNHPCCVIAVSQKMIDEHPEIVKEIVKIHIRATDYVNANINESAAIYAKKTGDNEAVSVKSMNEWDGTWLSDPHVIAKEVTAYSDSQYNSGLITKKLTVDDIFDFTFYDAVMNEL